MKNTQIFQRHELKYLISKAQKEQIIQDISSYMHLDSYGKTKIRNIYFDTDSYLLIRRSIEKPIYKEKLRIRSYKKTNEYSEVFVELKKKYKSVVYKRRTMLSEKDAMDWIVHKKMPSVDTQIHREIEYFIHYYENLHPALFLAYDREAYYCDYDKNFRITFDENILYRTTFLSLEEEVFGTNLLDKQQVLMEIKCMGSIPVWMSNILANKKIYKTSFSKYGMAYKQIMYSKEED